jgi:hypothetical protein
LAAGFDFVVRSEHFFVYTFMNGLPTLQSVSENVAMWSVADNDFAAILNAGQPAGQALARWGLRLLKQQRIDEAAAVLRSALALAPCDPALWINYGLTLDNPRITQKPPLVLRNPSPFLRISRMPGCSWVWHAKRAGISWVRKPLTARLLNWTPFTSLPGNALVYSRKRKRITPPRLSISITAFVPEAPVHRSWPISASFAFRPADFRKPMTLTERR